MPGKKTSEDGRSSVEEVSRRRRNSTLRMALDSALRVKGFSTMPTMPLSKACCCCSGSTLAVMATMGTAQKGGREKWRWVPAGVGCFPVSRLGLHLFLLPLCSPCLFSLHLSACVMYSMCWRLSACEPLRVLALECKRALVCACACHVLRSSCFLTCQQQHTEDKREKKRPAGKPCSTASPWIAVEASYPFCWVCGER